MNDEKENNDKEEVVTYTLEEQFHSFSSRQDPNSGLSIMTGPTITLYQSDYWLRQAKILEDRHVTISDTGKLFYKFGKSAITYDEWLEFLTDLCELKNLEREDVEGYLTNCGIPDAVPVLVPQYRDFFDTYVPRNKLIY